MHPFGYHNIFFPPFCVCEYQMLIFTGGCSIQFRVRDLAWAGGGPKGGGSKTFSGFGGFFESPYVLNILNMHKWGKMFFYDSSEMKIVGRNQYGYITHAGSP